MKSARLKGGGFNLLYGNKGDIILAREAPVGEVGIIKKGYNVCLGQRTVLLSVKNDSVDNYYLIYYLVNPVIKFELISRSTGSVVAHLNMKDIQAFEISALLI